MAAVELNGLTEYSQHFIVINFELARIRARRDQLLSTIAPAIPVP